MKIILKLFASLAINGVALLVAARLVSGLTIAGTVRDIVILAIVFTALNWFVRPLLKLVMTPLIILTLGLGILAVNGIILYSLDFLSETLTIESVVALLFATIIISITNFVLHVLVRK